MSNHELVEMVADEPWDYLSTWHIRCSCGWNSYYMKDAYVGARAWIRHRDLDADDRYTWAEMEDEWRAGHAEGYDQGFDEGEAEGRQLGRDELIEQLNKLKEDADGSPTLPSA